MGDSIRPPHIANSPHTGSPPEAQALMARRMHLDWSSDQSTCRQRDSSPHGPRTPSPRTAAWPAPTCRHSHWRRQSRQAHRRLRHQQHRPGWPHRTTLLRELPPPSNLVPDLLTALGLPRSSRACAILSRQLAARPAARRVGNQSLTAVTVCKASCAESGQPRRAATSRSEARSPIPPSKRWLCRTFRGLSHHERTRRTDPETPSTLPILNAH